MGDFIQSAWPRAQEEKSWLALLILILIATQFSDAFLSPDNLINILRQVSIMGMVAIGITLALSAGHFDLSVGAIVTLGGVAALELQPLTPLTTVIAIIVPMGLGALVGLVNGMLIGKFRANSIVVTVGMQLVVTGIVLVGVGGRHVRMDSASEYFIAISEGASLGIPHSVWLMLTAFSIAGFVAARTPFGRALRAVGSNYEAARLSGIRPQRIVVAAFVLSGLTAATAGVLLASRVRNLDPTAGIGYEFAALTAVVLGGARLTGGHARMSDTLAGVLFLGVLANIMILLNLSHHLQLFAQGLILIIATAYGAKAWRNKR
jgi:ribose transport system permease protein